MSKDSTYQGASIVAPKVEKHFLRQLAVAREKGTTSLAPIPSLEEIESIINVAFWASLRREEGSSPKISLAYLPPELALHHLHFGQRLALTTTNLTKLAPGIERSGIHLCLWREDGELYIWGTTLRIPDLCFILDVSEPGLLVVKHRRLNGLGKFMNVAVLIGDQVKVVDESSAGFADCPPFIASLLNFDTGQADSVNVLVQLAVAMRAHGNGGLLLMVPAKSTSWRESIIHPMKYTAVPSYRNLSDLIYEKGESPDSWKASMEQEIVYLGGFTAIDGATVINDRFELLGFGAKIARREGYSGVEKVWITEPIEGGTAAFVSASGSGGTRHLSAAQFVHDQQDALALVASQDGYFTVFSWSQSRELVLGYKIETLLL